MQSIKGSWIVGAVLGLLGYGGAAIALVLTNISEAAGVLFILAILFCPAGFAVGAVAGRAFGKRSLISAGASGFFAGLSLPLLVYFFGISISGFQDQSRRLAYDAKSKSEYKAAKERGFIFPPDVVTGLVGQVWSKETLTDVRDFYNRELSADWDRRDLGTTAWYVRKSTIAGQYDQIQLRKEYGRTSIYFRTTDHQQLKVQVAGAFAVAVENSDWKTALSLCGSELAIQGATKVKESFKGLKPSSSAFVRKYMPPGNSAPIGVNAKLELGENTFRSGEIGLDMSDDTIPLVKRIETSLP